MTLPRRYRFLRFALCLRLGLTLTFDYFGDPITLVTLILFRDLFRDLFRYVSGYGFRDDYSGLHGVLHTTFRNGYGVVSRVYGNVESRFRVLFYPLGFCLMLFKDLCLILMRSFEMRNSGIMVTEDTTQF
jgi:hypothetical protein